MAKNFFENLTTTENNDLTFISSLHAVLDLYYKVPSFRGRSEGVVDLVQEAWKENPNLTAKALFYIRDILYGLGERETFRVAINYLAKHYPDKIRHLVKYIPDYGRWDDMFALFGTPLEGVALDEIVSALRSGNGLCAKWMPREHKKGYKPYGEIVRKALGLSAKGYRKLLSGLTNVVETKMCRKEWGTIRYDHVPSVAFNKYKQAFFKHDADRFSAFLESVKQGKAKINAKAIYPHDIIKNIFYGKLSKQELEAVELQWKQLPDLVGDMSFLPICDTSSSMFATYYGKLSPITICIALGIYLSERNKSVFKDLVLTFNTTPTFFRLSGSLKDKVNQIASLSWGGSTNLVKAFELILNIAYKNNVPDSDMPKNILVISDMQFNQCNPEYFNSIEEIKTKYQFYGYTFPNVYFWNVGAYNTVPVTYNKYGFVLVGGFSPNIMRYLLSGDITPEKIMMNTLMSERYKKIVVE